MGSLRTHVVLLLDEQVPIPGSAALVGVSVVGYGKSCFAHLTERTRTLLLATQLINLSYLCYFTLQLPRCFYQNELRHLGGVQRGENTRDSFLCSYHALSWYVMNYQILYKPAPTFKSESLYTHYTTTPCHRRKIPMPSQMPSLTT